MFPHPPSAAKVNISRSNIRKKIPGIGDSIKESNRIENSLNNNKTLSGSTSVVKSLSPVKQINMNTRSNVKKKAAKNEESGVIASRTRLRVGRIVGKRDPFSRYTPLPAIGNREEKEKKEKIKQSKTSVKRSLPKSMEKHFPEHSNHLSDEGLSDTIKRMRLGLDFGTSTSVQRENQSSRCSEEINTSRPNNMELEEKDGTGINLIIRLPDGSRVQNKFKETDLLQKIVQFLSQQMKCSINLTKYVLYLNEVPKRELKNIKSTLSRLSIKDRSLLALDTRD